LRETFCIVNTGMPFKDSHQLFLTNMPIPHESIAVTTDNHQKIQKKYSLKSIHDQLNPTKGCILYRVFNRCFTWKGLYLKGRQSILEPLYK